MYITVGINIGTTYDDDDVTLVKLHILSVP